MTTDNYYQTIGGEMKPINKELSNPMVKAYGEHTIRDIKCKTCKYFIKKTRGEAYFKCSFRGNTSSAKTDHRANWPACSKFIPK